MANQRSRPQSWASRQRPPGRLADAVRPSVELEAEVVPGLETFAEEEMAAAGALSIAVGEREGRLQFMFAGDTANLHRLRSVNSVHRVLRFDVPRPLALLGHQHFSRIAGAISEIVGATLAGAFSTLRINAAGADSRVFQRMTQEMAAATGLEPTEGAPNLQLTVRPGEAGWEVLIRTTPLPLSARPWRVCNLAGALSGPVAHVMAVLLRPRKDSTLVNLCCGSGTLMVEALEFKGFRRAIGIDLEPAALRCASENLTAAGNGGRAALIRGDAGRLPLRDGSVRFMTADPPFGMLVQPGGRADELYARIADEAGRVLAPGGRFTLISTKGRTVREVLEGHAEELAITRTVPLKVPHAGGYLTPSIYVIERR